MKERIGQAPKVDGQKRKKSRLLCYSERKRKQHQKLDMENKYVVYTKRVQAYELVVVSETIETPIDSR